MPGPPGPISLINPDQVVTSSQNGQKVRATVTLRGVAATPQRAECFKQHTAARRKALYIYIGCSSDEKNQPVAHAIVPIRRLPGNPNRRHEDQLRHVLWMLQCVHGGKVATHAAAAALQNDARANQAHCLCQPVAGKHEPLQTEVTAHAVKTLRRSVTYGW